ncbi:septation protein SepH [Amycolatopsis sp. CA-230715]|uniref:septation protein SepH n=1 Tax=Amycolatopsis sp. CA-230715 TaxID=2745196 RepID=UPI001C0392FB|nr:septation protein SepH [Amycolatopsis sp. CA-230715]QWF81707.1 hypothetical protein HUW46_05140 [Amycolatopsis sp. CA-230715]
MRALRVVGLHEDGKSIVCEDPARRERFLLPADERLRAAARGDITRLGQIEIELESQMRPREIQARIRAGESVEQVATSAGVPEQRVERFAYPVLLERSRTAELAQHAHPVREDGPDVRTLGEVVHYAFGVRGQDYTQATWDSWKGDDGKWVVGLQWQAGRSDNAAHWAFSPGAHGGTVTALDEPAEDLLNPNAHRQPRTLRAVSEDDQPTLESSLDGAPDPQDDDTREIPRVPAEEPAEAPADSAEAKPEPARPKSKKNHPIVPSWEDVLLGVRSQRG